MVKVKVKIPKKLRAKTYVFGDFEYEIFMNVKDKTDFDLHFWHMTLIFRGNFF